MASRTTLTRENLAALGAERLADLTLALAAADAAAKRQVRMALAAAAGPEEAARAIRKRLVTLAAAQSFLSGDRERDLGRDLETHRAAILRDVAPGDPVEALDLLFRFLELARPTLGRVERGYDLAAVFSAAAADLGRLAAQAGADPSGLAARAFPLVVDNPFEVFDALVPGLAPALGPPGLDRLEALAHAYLAASPAVGLGDDFQLLRGAHPSGKDRKRLHKLRVAEPILAAIAEARGDLDGLIALIPETRRAFPLVAAEIAGRLLDAGRAEEALAALDKVEAPETWLQGEEWMDARLAVLDALGRGAEAQDLRWRWFERRLAPRFLREHLRRLPDFDDVEAETRALAHVRAAANLEAALDFLVAWPALELAADLVLARADDIDGDRYDIHVAAAEALETRHPLAATLLRRAMIDFALGRGLASRYRHAARHLAECQGLAARIADYGRFEPHAAYAARLKAEHGRKASFWLNVP